MAIAEPFDPDSPLAPELEELERDYESIEEEIAELVEGLSDEQLLWRPAPERWSIAEAFDHLNLTGYKLLPRLDRAMADARSEGRLAQKPYRHGWMVRRMLAFMEPPPGLRMKVPKIYDPPQPDEPRRVVRELVELQGEFVKRLREMNGLDLAGVKVASPMTRLLKLPLAAWMAFLAAHERRHLWQARQVREDDAFPR